MSSQNRLTLVKPSSRFERLTTTQLARPSPTSPMVLQMLMQSIMNLDQKVNALALREPRSVVVRDDQPSPKEVGSQSTTVTVRPVQEQPPTSQREVKIKRSKLLDIFD